MDTEIIITFEGDYIKIVTIGGHDFEVAKKLWSGTVRACEANDCYKVLGVANTKDPISLTEGFDHVQLFSDLGIDHKYKIAWVERNPAVIEKYRFIETLLENQGLPGTVFDNIKEAKSWLLQDN